MKTYKIIRKNEVTHVFKSKHSLDFLKTNPALFFVFDGNYQVERCGQLTALKQLRNHISTLINKRR